jgi:mannonate dehydratase
MEPSIHHFAIGDKNPLAYYRQVPGVQRLVVDLGGAPGQAVQRDWIDHVLELLASAGLGLAVVESFVVSNAIKLELPERDAHIDCFCQTLRHFGAAMRAAGHEGPYRVCYDFMGPENWWRNLLSLRDERDRVCVGYDPRQPEPELESLGDGPRLGYPESYSPQQYDRLLEQYAERGEEGLWSGLEYFLKAIIPVAEEQHILMGLHPDDPAFNVRGRARIIKNAAALKRAVDLVPSQSNGITYCPGSLATNPNNDVEAIAADLWPHFVFCHFRNIRFLTDEELQGEWAFFETYHEDRAGAVPLAKILGILHEKGCAVPYRADHAPGMYGHDANLGYGLMARAQGLSYLNGILRGLEQYNPRQDHP